MPITCGLSIGSIGLICHHWRKGWSTRIRISEQRTSHGVMVIRYVMQQVKMLESRDVTDPEFLDFIVSDAHL